MPIKETIIHDLAVAVSPDAVVADADSLSEAGRDFWAQRGMPGVLVRAGSTDDVVATLRFAQERGIRVVPRGAGTNVGGGFLPSPESILLDLRQMNRVLSIDPEQRVAVVEPGLLNGNLQHQLEPYGLCYSPDPASVPLCSIGGNIAENSGGPHCLKYGVTVHHVDSVDCVLIGGDVVRLSALDQGPDLLGVMIGSEGTLGVVTQARLRLRPLPSTTSSLLVAFDALDAAIDAVSEILRAGVIPAALEFMDRASVDLAEAMAPTGYPGDAEAILLIDVDGDTAEVAAQMSTIESILRRRTREIRRADDPAERAALWRGRLQIGQATRASGRAFYVGDTTVPRERIALLQRAVQRFADHYRLDVFTTGHAGDGNIHPIVLFDRDNPGEVERMQHLVRDMAGMALELGGTLTGEHGVGSEKRPLMRQRFSPAEIAAMRVVKLAFDPDELLNPGVLLPDESPEEPVLPLFFAAVERALSATRSDSESPRFPWPNSSPGRGDEATVNIDAENLTTTVAAGVTLTTLRSRLATNGFCTDVCETADGLTQTLAEAMSDHRLRANVRGSLLAVDATLPDGPRVRFGSQARKDVAGYDLKRLYTGGTDVFGKVNEVTLQIRPISATGG